MAQQNGPAPPEPQDAPAPHRTTTVERGPFCTAHCTCGWRGPARRARSLARSDAESHANA
ncbi:hypothetical protein [Streptomyces zinciresistens]|uniref:hypothetical protein n=1 Tax=Streptomyces zinciresistens TaxID=1073330 RepID=UPI000997752D|nr:hypothetical protein [Streptomyces zinciresistens]